MTPHSGHTEASRRDSFLGFHPAKPLRLVLAHPCQRLNTQNDAAAAQAQKTASASLRAELSPLKSVCQSFSLQFQERSLTGQRCHSDEVQPEVGGPLLQHDPWPYKREIRTQGGRGLGLVLPETQ